MIEHKQINSVKRKKSNCNAAYILFSVYNTDADIHYVNMFLPHNGAGITLGCQQTHNCCSQMKLHT